MVKASTLGAALLAVSTLCMAPDAHAVMGGDDLGINIHLSGNDVIQMTQTLGVSWVRVDGVWPAISTSSGHYNFSEIDRVVDQASSRGLKSYVSLGGTPSWVPRVSRTRSDSTTDNDEPLTSNEWSAFVTAAVVHLRAHGVRNFGMWNEPNLDSF